jgi:acetyltransferase
MRTKALDKLFAPRSLALLTDGAVEEGTAAAALLGRLLAAGFPGEITVVSPRAPAILPTGAGHEQELEQAVDLALLLLPLSASPMALRQLAEIGCAAAVLLSPSGGERGPYSRSVLQELADIARSHDMALLGPDSLGVLRPAAKLHAAVVEGELRAGNVALLTRSLGFGSALLDWAEANVLGFSLVASPGDLGVDEGDLLDYLSMDAGTRGVLLCLERVPDARPFISGLRAAARVKPVVVLKSDRGASSGDAYSLSDHVFDAAIARAGAVRVNTVHQLFTAARALMAGIRVAGPRLAILGNASAPSIMAADRAARRGVVLAPPEETLWAALRSAVPGARLAGPAVDLLGDAGPEAYAAAASALLTAPGYDGLLVLLTPQPQTDPLACAEALIQSLGERQRRPVLACWMGQNRVAAARERLTQAGILQFSSPERCLDAFAYLAAYERNQAVLLQAPPPSANRAAADVAGARLMIEEALSQRRGRLTASEATAVLTAFHVPVLNTLAAHSPGDALVAAETLGLPVTLTINNADEVAAGTTLQRRVQEPTAVRSAYHDLLAQAARDHPQLQVEGVGVRRLREGGELRKLLLSIEHDADFGPVLRLADGTRSARDAGAVALPPLNLFLARDLLRRALGTGSWLREGSAEESALLEVLMRLSEICCRLPEVRSLRINPLQVGGLSVTAEEVAMEVAPQHASTRRYGHMAIHPYPVELEHRWQLPKGGDVVIRPIRPEDADLERAFVDGLSPESRYNRFMYRMDKLTPAMLARFTQIDYDREMALAVVLEEGAGGSRLIAVARYVSNPDGASCEFALTVADAMQGQGIGRQLMQALMNAARDRGFRLMVGDVLSSNRRMLRLCESLGFRLLRSREDPEVVAVRRQL